MCSAQATPLWFCSSCATSALRKPHPSFSAHERKGVTLPFSTFTFRGNFHFSCSHTPSLVQLLPPAHNCRGSFTPLPRPRPDFWYWLDLSPTCPSKNTRLCSSTTSRGRKVFHSFIPLHLFWSTLTTYQGLDSHPAHTLITLYPGWHLQWLHLFTTCLLILPNEDFWIHKVICFICAAIGRWNTVNWFKICVSIMLSRISCWMCVVVQWL